MLDNEDFQTWRLIGSCVRKYVLITNPGYCIVIQTFLWDSQNTQERQVNIILMPLFLASPGHQQEFRWLRWRFSFWHLIPRTCDTAQAAYEMLLYKNICLYLFKPIQHNHLNVLGKFLDVRQNLGERFRNWNDHGLSRYVLWNIFITRRKAARVDVSIHNCQQYKVIISFIRHIEITSWYGNGFLITTILLGYPPAIDAPLSQRPAVFSLLLPRTKCWTNISVAGGFRRRDVTSVSRCSGVVRPIEWLAQDLLSSMTIYRLFCVGHGLNQF